MVPNIFRARASSEGVLDGAPRLFRLATGVAGAPEACFLVCRTSFALRIHAALTTRLRRPVSSLSGLFPVEAEGGNPPPNILRASGDAARNPRFYDHQAALGQAKSLYAVISTLLGQAERPEPYGCASRAGHAAEVDGTAGTGSTRTGGRRADACIEKACFSGGQAQSRESSPYRPPLKIVALSAGHPAAPRSATERSAL